MLSFGLIWLTYLRNRERRVTLEGLALYLPAGDERSTALRLLCLNPEAANFQLFTYTHDDILAAARSARLRQSGYPPGALHAAGVRTWRTRGGEIAALPGVERVAKHDGRTSLRVRGIEFAELSARGMLFGLQGGARRRSTTPPKSRASPKNWIACAHTAADREHPLYRQYPEAWLESQARAEIETLDATLRREPIYGQVPAFAGGERGILDLLAVDYSGRLTVWN